MKYKHALLYPANVFCNIVEYVRPMLISRPVGISRPMPVKVNINFITFVNIMAKFIAILVMER